MLIVFIAIFAFTALVVCQTRPTQPPRLTVSIVPTFASFDGKEPLVVSIHIKNSSQKNVRTEYLPRVVLEKMTDGLEQPAKAEWTVEAAVRLDRKSPYAKRDYFRPGKAASISVDLHSLEWNDPKSSILGNSKLAFILSPGRYRLSAVMIETTYEGGTKRNDRVTSNEVYLRYQ